MPCASLVASAFLGPEASATERAARRRWPERCYRQVSFDEAPNNQSVVPVTATGHCPVPVRPRRAKTSFPGREAAPLRFAAPSVWVQKGCCAGLRSASASAATRTTLAWATATTLAANTREQEGGWPQQHRQRVLRTLPPKKEKHWGSPVETRCRRCPPLRVLV